MTRDPPKMITSIHSYQGDSHVTFEKLKWPPPQIPTTPDLLPSHDISIQYIDAEGQVQRDYNLLEETTRDFTGL